MPPRAVSDPTPLDAMHGGFTASFEIRYVDGAAGDRVADAQANAISALLTWLAHRDATMTDHAVLQPEHTSVR